MSFNYYAKMVKILEKYNNWYIVKYNIACKTKRFNGEYNYYDHYYKIFDQNSKYIKYTKFYQLEVLSTYLKVDIGYLESRIKKEELND